MFLLFLYFTLNFLGFLVFLFIWNRIPKPKPFDYTTIPGLKLDVDDAEKIPALDLKPGSRPDFEQHRGHLDEVEKSPSCQAFLHFLFLTYGPLNSFWFSTRYVVTVADESMVAEIKKNRASLLAISPFALGSYLLGEEKYCTTVEMTSIHITKTAKSIDIDPQLDSKVQENKFLKNQKSENKKDDPCFKRDIPQIVRNLRQVENVYKNRDETLRQKLSRPLLVVFDEEIWVDAHPVPKFVPIIINTDVIISNWSDDELFPKFYSIFYWVPGFQDLHDII